MEDSFFDNLDSNSHEVKIPLEKVKDVLAPVLMRVFKNIRPSDIQLEEHPRTEHTWIALGRANDAGILAMDLSIGSKVVEIRFPSQEVGKVKAVQRALLRESGVVTTFSDSGITFVHNSNRLHKAVNTPRFSQAVDRNLSRLDEGRGF